MVGEAMKGRYDFVVGSSWMGSRRIRGCMVVLPGKAGGD